MSVYEHKYSDDNLQKFVLFFYHVGPGDEGHIARLGNTRDQYHQPRKLSLPLQICKEGFSTVGKNYKFMLMYMTLRDSLILVIRKSYFVLLGMLR